MDTSTLINTTLYILEGTGVTLKVYFVTLIFSIPLGILCAMGKLCRFRILHAIIGVYTWVFRGTPLMLQLMFVYYGLAIMVSGTALENVLTFSPLQAACVAFIINYTAYFTEIFRAGIQSIERGQYEASQALGLTPWLTMKRIVLPQAMKVIIPPLGNEAITLVKDTALCFVIALPEILKNASTTVSREFDVTAYFIAAAIYLILTFVIIQIFHLIERRFDYY